MTEFLHAGSLAATGVGACCVALDGPRLRVREIVLSVVMVLAMLDVVLGTAVVPVVVWSALMLALAMALAVRRRGTIEPASVSRMRAMAGVGAVLMAGLMLVMVPTAAPGSSSTHHGGGDVDLTFAIVLAGCGYAAVCAYLGWRRHPIPPGHGGRRAVILGRVQVASMAGSVLLLALAASA